MYYEISLAFRIFQDSKKHLCKRCWSIYWLNSCYFSL